MINFLEILQEILGSEQILLLAATSAICIKSSILFSLILNGIQSKYARHAWIFFTTVLLCSLMSDITWIIWLSKSLLFKSPDTMVLSLFIRLSWAFSVIQYQALALFIESLTTRKYIISLHQKIFIIISSSFFILFIYAAYIQYNNQEYLEHMLQTISTLYLIGIVMLTTLLLVLQKIRTTFLPRIITKQLKTLIKAFIIPCLCADLLQLYPFQLIFINTLGFYSLVSLSSIFLTYAIIYSWRKIIDLRFLNFNSHVQTTTKFSFIDDFKSLLDTLSKVSHSKEIKIITQAFFQKAFKIPINRTSVQIRTIDNFQRANFQQTIHEIKEFSPLEIIVENFINHHSNEGCKIANFLQESKIIIYDEIVFNNFYEENEINKQILHFLNRINADIFLPIYDQNTVVLYVIIEKNSRYNDFYSNVERDEMIIFSAYLSNIIRSMNTRALGNLIYKQKQLQEELENKNQEIKQYKESVRSFLRTTKNNKIGIISFKNNRFSFANQAAKDLISINLNLHDGHQLTKQFKTIVQQVLDYKTMQTMFGHDSNNNEIILSGLSNLEDNSILILAYYPEISDIIKKQFDTLKNPSEWDYLLYLESTQAGQLINNLIPSNSEQFLNFKINLLKSALQKKALLLEIPDNDLLVTVEIFHHISLRTTLHILELTNYTTNYTPVIELFGINPLLTLEHKQSLLERLNNTGTLFIKNIHYLPLEAQEQLAIFIKYGYYHLFKSEQKIYSNVRIICSTDQNLSEMTQQGKFSSALLKELAQTIIIMPSLTQLPHNEFHALAQGFIQQTLKNSSFSSCLEITEKETTKIINTHPLSLYDLKERIKELIHNKSKKYAIQLDTINLQPDIYDDAIIETLKLGKKALKNKNAMELLWVAFKNQNKIASLLGVNRSSVNRRCKAYNLQ